MSEIEKLKSVNKRLRKDLKFVLRKAKMLRDFKKSLQYCYDESHRK